MNLFARQVRTLMTAATAAAVVAAGGVGAGCGKKLGRETVPETPDTLPITYDTLIDGRDGKTYKTVKMPDGKVWMAQNINYQANSGSWCYDDDNSNCEKYGRLYDWNTAKTVCPVGFHLPSREEWDNLLQAAGGERTQMDQGASKNVLYNGVGKKLKARSGWDDYYDASGNGTDEYGFSALPGGIYNVNDGFGFTEIGDGGFWYKATEMDSGNAYGWFMYGDDSVCESEGGKTRAYSVRCVADPE
ncbi:hypothetical protein R80B4_02012 [Fibrobacteres bacterium R8-0-B4]